MVSKGRNHLTGGDLIRKIFELPKIIFGPEPSFLDFRHLIAQAKMRYKGQTLIVRSEVDIN